MEEEQIQNQEQDQDQDQEASSMALLPIDSFSYSWLLNFPSSIIDHHHHHHHSYDDSSSFIEMDPRLPPSRRFFINESFKFDNFVSFSQNQSNLLHADELFRDGYVLPYLLTDLKSETVRDQSEPLDEMTKIEISKSTKRKLSSCVKLRRLVLKYLLTPLCSRLRRFRSSGLRSTETTRRNRVYSDETTSSPRVSVQADDYWRRSCDSESSIYEAVLHCKKSFEK